MNEANRKLELLGRAPVPKALLALGLPTMLGMTVNALYNLVDAYFVGGLGNSQLGAISVVFPLGQVLVGLGLLFGSGAASYLSRLLGQRDRERANSVASTALYGSMLVGAAATLCAALFLPQLLQLLGATAGILPYALAYSRIYLIAALLNVCNVALNNIITSEGAAKATMGALLAGALLNMLLDPVLIYGLRCGVAGAAIATVLAQAATSAFYLWYILSKRSMFRFRPGDCRFSKEILAEIFKIGVPTMVFQLLTSLSVALVNLQAGVYGDALIAGMGAVMRILSMGSLIVFGFIKGFQPIAGYSYGAGDLLRLRQAIRLSLVWSTAFCVLFGAVLALFPAAILAQFTKEDWSMVQLCAVALRFSGLSFMLFGFQTVYSSLFLALGRGKEGFLLGACRQGLCFAPIILLLPARIGVNGVLFAQPLADLCSAAITLWMAARLHRTLLRPGA